MASRDAASSKIFSLEVSLIAKGLFYASQIDSWGYCFVCSSYPFTFEGFFMLPLV